MNDFRGGIVMLRIVALVWLMVSGDWTSQGAMAWIAPAIRSHSNLPHEGQREHVFQLFAQGEFKKKNKAMLKFMEKPLENIVGDNPPPASVPIDDDPDAEFVRCIAKAADLRKADQIVALRISPVSTMASFLVILSGNSRPQNQAIAAAIMEDVEEQYENLKPNGDGVPEGTADSGWMLLDYGSVMVHIMTPKSRLYYNVEGQWREKGAEELDLSNVLIPNNVPPMDQSAAPAPASYDQTTMDIEQEEDDPFWS